MPKKYSDRVSLEYVWMLMLCVYVTLAKLNYLIVKSPFQRLEIWIRFMCVLSFYSYFCFVFHQTNNEQPIFLYFLLCWIATSFKVPEINQKPFCVFSAIALSVIAIKDNIATTYFTHKYLFFACRDFFVLVISER